MTATPLQLESGMIHGLTEDEIEHELLMCAMSVEYFVDTYVKIKHQRRWVPFKLWPKQVEALRAMMAHKKLVVLKSRQVGASWLALAKSLWRMVFRPGSATLILSLREEEALALVRMRLKPMFERLPAWMRPEATSEGVKHWTLATGTDAPTDHPDVEGLPRLPVDGPKIHSVCVALPSNRGDSYVADDVIVDEADLIRKLAPLLESLEPTIEDNPDASLTLLSRVDKSNPGSTYQNICRSALDGESDYHLVFIGVFDHPHRTQEWYDKLCKAAVHKYGSLDSVHAAYPRNPEEALKPKAQGKRIPPEWLEAVYKYRDPTPLSAVDGAPAMTGIRLYCPPMPGVRYVIGADVAEGVGGDDSAAVVARLDNGEVVAVLAGQFEPKLQYPTMLRALCRWYNDAGCLPERNNHGHATIGKLQEFRVKVLDGYDGKPGWLTTNTATGINASKVEMWSRAALAVKQEDCAIYDQRLYFQVGAIDAGTLAHPSKKSGKKRVDDESMAFALAMAARATPSKAAWLDGFSNRNSK
jgi:hypothetical protein